jgi:hypothetical protein
LLQGSGASNTAAVVRCDCPGLILTNGRRPDVFDVCLNISEIAATTFTTNFEIMNRRDTRKTSSRRTMLQRLLAGAAGTALLSPVVGKLFASNEPLQMSTFVGREGSRFVATSSTGQSVTLVLDNVVGGIQKATTPSALDCEWFSLAFDGPRGWEAVQDVYSFENAEIGRFETLLTPVWSEHGRPRVGSITNRIIT